MMSYIWSAMICSSFLFAFLSGKLQPVTESLLNSATESVTMIFSLMGIMCFWTGLMKIAEDSGLTEIFALILRPLTKIIFPKIPQNSKAMNFIVMNMVANLLGLSNAATPLGLSAMKELKRLSKNGSEASHDMCMFSVINTASISLIPSTVIALRSAAGSENPFEIVVPVWICSVMAAFIGIGTAKLCAKKTKTYRLKSVV